MKRFYEIILSLLTNKAKTFWKWMISENESHRSFFILQKKSNLGLLETNVLYRLVVENDFLGSRILCDFTLFKELSTKIKSRCQKNVPWYYTGCSIWHDKSNQFTGVRLNFATNFPFYVYFCHGLVIRHDLSLLSIFRINLLKIVNNQI